MNTPLTILGRQFILRPEPNGSKLLVAADDQGISNDEWEAFCAMEREKMRAFERARLARKAEVLASFNL